jgi:hypothetical protein
MFFDLQLNGGELYYLMAIGFGVNSCEFLATASTSLGIVVGNSCTFFYRIQGTTMTGVSWLTSSLFSCWLFFLGLLDVGSVGGGRTMGVLRVTIDFLGKLLL